MDTGEKPDVRKMLKSLVKEIFEIPDKIKELAAGRWEIEKQLLDFRDEAETAKLEENLCCTDQELEWLRNRQSAVVTTVNLLAALASAGKLEETKEVEEVLKKALKKELEIKKDETNTAKQAKENANNSDTKDSNKNKSKDQEELKTGVFLIKKTKPGKKEDIVWATAVDESGKEFEICGQNGKGKTLLEAVNKKVKVKYRHLDAKKLFAVGVEIIDMN